MIDNLITVLLAMLVYLLFWLANTIASLILNIAVIGEEWNKEKFIRSIWKLLGMLAVVVLLTMGLSLASSEAITIATLIDIIYVAAFTRLAEAITKVKDMFGYKTPDPQPEPEPEPIPSGDDEDEYYEG